MTIKAEITIKVVCDTQEEADAARKKLEEAGAKITDLGLNTKTFTGVIQQVLEQP